MSKQLTILFLLFSSLLNLAGQALEYSMNDTPCASL